MDRKENHSILNSLETKVLFYSCVCITRQIFLLFSGKLNNSIFLLPPRLVSRYDDRSLCASQNISLLKRTSNISEIIFNIQL